MMLRLETWLRSVGVFFALPTQLLGWMARGVAATCTTFPIQLHPTLLEWDIRLQLRPRGGRSLPLVV